ncbi:MAG TPA: helix-turn-helix transcriptional regulator [Thermoanaerobaculia bacterium]|nr:helix-turn-helix transcriptional regulator [Thermoanaerobaculia bacterium]HUM30506.1 helix-turn-helix transcriptional regulator [Thermoanaerobaculia bacterium]HXK68627.1 helix-turn-helix transcriptional regulator [Thermoanaerobaculia bacterium]
MAIHTRIAELRDERGWTQGELADKIGVHIQTLGRWERQKSKPDSDDIINLAKTFEVTSDYLLFDNVPRDGRVDVPDLELLRLFEALCTLGGESRDLVKRFLKAFVFREELLTDLSGGEKK